MSVIYCGDCPATSATAFVDVDEELCIECRDARRAEDDR